MRLAMIGAGYVGLVSGACFAEFGHHVVCVDRDAERISGLNAGRIPIYEPGLDKAIASSVGAGRLKFSADLAAAVADAEVIFIAVGTPSRAADRDVDLSFVFDAAREIARALRRYSVIVTKSTVPPGTSDQIETIMRKERPDADFAVASNPEFLREGVAIEEFKRPDRIVIGSSDTRARDVVAAVYRPLYLNEAPFLFTDRRSSELIKYASNAFLATKVAFINEMADLCEKVGADVRDVARGIGLDKRIGSKFLHPGPGFGGSCLPKDLRGLTRTAEKAGIEMAIVRTVESVNTQRRAGMAQRVIDAVGDVSAATVAVLGLTFKPNTDDMREAPSLSLIAGLQRAGVAIRVFDPKGAENARKLLSSVTFADDPYDCATGADALVIVTEWEVFRALDFDRLRSCLKRPILVDLRNIYVPEEMQALGYEYHSIGRPGRKD